MKYILQQSGFVLRKRYLRRFSSFFRKAWLRTFGMQIGKNTAVPSLVITWPHQVSLGEDCKLEDSIYFKFDGIWKKGPSIRIKNRVFIGSNCEFNIRKEISIGDDCLIASGCRFIDHDHGTALGMLIRDQHGEEGPIQLHQNVWLGANVIVLKGVEIGQGAIVAAGAVVVRSIPENEIWGGVPAKKIGVRA
ncbi:acyltransferase [Pedobacter metabolipauper]|uniref:Succinyltransferase-like protein n=1 Tax=Pedobacter metabolipauper TaxID=425513 RepID=A0A4V3D1B6_9SPHI|nr:acyltransferase [Pedobacter metabolipauper]TDQ09987.1 succinyltransferase-like protein [Pedobacter metabolipauper]